MTNADQIRQMTDEELVKSIGLACKRCAYRAASIDECADRDCTDGNLEWLKQEVNEDAGVRLIDANALKNSFDSAYTVYGQCVYAKGIVDRQPTIEAAPVRHGYWIECDYKHLEHGEIETEPNAGLCCSVCRTGFQKKKMTYKQYCAACGAKMDVTDTNVDDKEDVDNGLKPCPFCGGKAELRQEDFDPRWMPTRNDPDSGGCPPYYVKCDDCGANTEYRYAYPDAEKLWNRRCNND